MSVLGIFDVRRFSLDANGNWEKYQDVSVLHALAKRTVPPLPCKAHVHVSGESPVVLGLE